MARLPLREAAAPVEIENADTRDYARPRRLTAAQQEALYFARKRRKMRQGFFTQPTEEGTDPEPEPELTNLLDGLTWTAGSNTTISQVNGRLRVARQGGNPRAYKLVTGLTIGATYRLSGGLYIGDSTQVVLRATNDAGLSAGPFTKTWTADVTVNETFVATATQHYVGPIGVSTVNGRYVEIDLDFALYEEPV